MDLVTWRAVRYAEGMRYPDGGGLTAPGLLNGFLARTGLDLVTPTIEDR